jgi:hypothetical protein
MKHPEAPAIPTRAGLTTLLWACAITVVLWFVPLASLALYPLRLFVTFIHEGSHALTALLTGGHVFRIVIDPDASGYTLTQGGWEPLIVMAGYLGATAYGAGPLALGRRPAFARPALSASAIWVGLLTLVFVRPWINPFGFFWGLAIVIALLLASWRLSARGTELLAMFLGVQCVVNALFDLRTLVGLSSGFGGPPTDAVLMSQIVPLPPLVWALLWCCAALAVLAFALRPYWRDARRV